MGGNKVAAPSSQPVTKKPSTTTSAAPKLGVGKTQGSTNGVKKFGGGDSEDVKALQEQVNELKMNNDTLDREREFYFSKLRDIEEML